MLLGNDSIYPVFTKKRLFNRINQGKVGELAGGV
jgi:hypothetical protein